jgi:hypothetical protein
LFAPYTLPANVPISPIPKPTTPHGGQTIERPAPSIVPVIPPAIVAPTNPAPTLPAVYNISSAVTILTRLTAVPIYPASFHTLCHSIHIYSCIKKSW